MSYGDVGRLGAVAIFGAIFAVIMGIIGLALYLFLSFALYKLAQKRGIDMPWLAWIPVAQMYILGQMVKKVNISTFEIPKLEMVLPGAMLAVIILGWIPVLGTLINLAFYVLLLITLYNLYNQYLPEKAMTYTLISILGVTVPFLLYGLRDKDPVNIP